MRKISTEGGQTVRPNPTLNRTCNRCRRPGLSQFWLGRRLLPHAGYFHGKPQDHMSPFECSFDKSKLDVEAIHAFLVSTYWSPGIPRETVELAINNSLCVGGYVDGQQVAFARLVTDRATFAYLADVFVIPSHRGRGLSRHLLETLMAHPDVQGLRRMLLVTRDAHYLYAKFDFKQLAAPDRFMERHNPNAYSAPSAT